MPRTTDKDSGLTAEVLRTIVRYDPCTGKFYWLKSNNQSAVIGGEAGSIEPKTGYVRFTVLGRKYQAHRLVWLHVHGVWPDCEIDHINLVKSDNCIGNLREALPRNNTANKRAYKNNLLGVKGVSENSSGRFVARIGHGGRVFHIGTYGTPDRAHAAYLVRAKELHGEFARGS